jgi:hypothetical protein
MSQEKNHNHAALVTDLGFCLEQLEDPRIELPDMAAGLIESRVAHHEAALGIANFTVAKTVEMVPLRATPEPVLMPVAA